MTATARAISGLLGSAEVPARREVAPATRTRVLVVDDDVCIRELLRLHLFQAGYSVRVTADAIEGGFQVLESAPDLMIVDVDMPHMNGIDFVAAVRADPLVPYFPVLFLSADESSAERARSLGAVFLSKPIRADRLLQAVDAVTRARRIQALA